MKSSAAQPAGGPEDFSKGALSIWVCSVPEKTLI